MRCVYIVTDGEITVATRPWTATTLFGRRSGPIRCMEKTINALIPSMIGLPPSTVRLARGRAAWFKDPTALMSQSKYTPESPTAHIARANSNSTWTFGYQYPETLVQWTDAERKAAAWAAIRKYTPLSPGSERYPPGAIHRGDRANLPGYPADLPGMIIQLRVCCI